MVEHRSPAPSTSAIATRRRKDRLTPAAPAAGLGSVRRRRVDTQRRSQLSLEVQDLLLAEGFTSFTMDDLAQRLHCSKATLYSVGGSKEQLVLTVTRQFFRQATEQIEIAVAALTDPRLRIPTYLAGVGDAMSRCSKDFYEDMISFGPTAEIYRLNSAAAAHRVQVLIADGVTDGALRPIDGNFAGQLIALAIEGLVSGILLERTGLSAGQAYSELADLLLHGLSASSKKEAPSRVKGRTP